MGEQIDRKGWTARNKADLSGGGHLGIWGGLDAEVAVVCLPGTAQAVLLKYQYFKMLMSVVWLLLVCQVTAREIFA